MAVSRESSEDDLPGSRGGLAGDPLRPDFDGEAPPPPPEFGTVSPSMSTTSAEMPTLPSSSEQPVPPSNNGRIVMVAAGVAVVLGIGGFAAGRLGADEPPGAPVTTSQAGAVVTETPAKPEAQPTPAPVNAQAAVKPRCPAGMVFVDAGKFFMGTSSTDPLLSNSRPAHQVTVPSFCLDETEVTLRAYRECSTVGECKRAFRDAWWPQGNSDTEAWDYSREQHSKLCNEGSDARLDHPVNCVTWEQANDFCRWRGAELPTEVQWEFAARGSEGRQYPWGDAEPDSERLNGCGAECTTWQASVDLPQTTRLYEDDDGFPGTAPVLSFAAGATKAGISDLAGNVFEWTADPFKPYPGSKTQADSGGSDKRVIRGGAFNSFRAGFADPALRFPQTPDAHTDAIGFRCAAEPRR